MDLNMIMSLVSGTSGGQGAGGALDAALGFGVTAALTPFLGSLAPIVGPMVAKLAKGLLKNLLGGVASLFGKQSRAPQEYTEQDRSYLNMLHTMGLKYKHDHASLAFSPPSMLFSRLDDAMFARADAKRHGDGFGVAMANREINAVRSEIAQRFDADFPGARNHEWHSAR